MEGEKNIYESGGMSPEERDRLKSLGSDYPLFISAEAIGEDIEGKSVLDIGSGPNTALGEWIKNEGGRYIAFDIDHRSLEDQKAAGNDAVEGDVGNLPFKPQSADITHDRLFLMHLSPERRRQAVQDMFQAAKERSIFVEPDWSSFEGNETVNRLRDLLIQFLSKRSDLHMGAKLKDQVEEFLSGSGASITEKRLPRDPGTNYDELKKMVGGLRSLAEKFQPDLLPEVANIAELIDKEASKEKPEPFVLPEFVYVEAKH